MVQLNLRFLACIIIIGLEGCVCTLRPISNVSIYRSLEPALNSDVKVEHLEIVNNRKYSKFPEDILKLTDLRILKFYGSWCDFEPCSNIKQIPKDIYRLKKLHELYLVSNELKKIPEGINKLDCLTILDLSDNVGINVSNIHNTSIQNLSLNGCGLDMLPENIYKLKNLKVLGLTGNNFDERLKLRIKQELQDVMVYF